MMHARYPGDEYEQYPLRTDTKTPISIQPGLCGSPH